MIFSVWNQGTRRYDYYESPQPEASANVEKPRHLRTRKLGSTVTQAAWPLPANARMVGSGDQAHGRIASRGGSALGAADDGGMGTVKIGMLLLSGFLLWKYVVPAKR